MQHILWQPAFLTCSSTSSFQRSPSRDGNAALTQHRAEHHCGLNRFFFPLYLYLQSCIRNELRLLKPSAVTVKSLGSGRYYLALEGRYYSCKHSSERFEEASGKFQIWGQQNTIQAEGLEEKCVIRSAALGGSFAFHLDKKA